MKLTGASRVIACALSTLILLTTASCGTALLPQIHHGPSGTSHLPPGAPTLGDGISIDGWNGGFYFVSRVSETYNSTKTQYGVVNSAGDWLLELSSTNGLAQVSREWRSDAYRAQYRKMSYSYLGDRMFVVGDTPQIVRDDGSTYGALVDWRAEHREAFTYNLNTDAYGGAGMIISLYHDGWALVKQGVFSQIMWLDDRGETYYFKTERGVPCDQFGPLREELFFCYHDYTASFYHSDGTLAFDLLDAGMTVSPTYHNKKGESIIPHFTGDRCYLEFKNPANTLYHVEINMTGQFLYDPVKGSAPPA